MDIGPGITLGAGVSITPPPTVPGAPTISTATATGATSATVAFTAPLNNGGATITSYTATSSPGNITGTLTQAGSGTITVSGLTASTSYTFTVTATNNIGTGSASAASNSITTNAPPTGQVAFTTAGTYSWVAPGGITSVCAVVVGAGGGGTGSAGGGGLGWKNNITVVPGQSYTVVVGAGRNIFNPTKGGQSYFISTSTLWGDGGNGIPTTSADFVQGGRGGWFNGDGGGEGGEGGIYRASPPTLIYGGHGGAGGYSGTGGTGAPSYLARGGTGSAGTGGSGGGGASGGQFSYAGNGGGVGLLGQGASGAGGYGYGTNTSAGIEPWPMGGPGFPGSNGLPRGGTYGGGAGLSANADGSSVDNGGAVRIIWGAGRAFPSTNTGDL
jgi:hypothetical protein